MAPLLPTEGMERRFRWLDWGWFKGGCKYSFEEFELRILYINGVSKVEARLP